MPQNLTTGHAHEVELEEALDFINTLELESGELVDHLHKPDDAASWFLDHDLVHGTEARGWTADDLERVRQVREALRDVIDGVVEDRSPNPSSLAIVNEALEGRRPARLELDGSTIRIGHRHDASPVPNALAVIAEAIVEELASGRPDRFRICANDRCRWAFYDESPTGRRRWCDMRTCGNRAKAARHRERAKAGAPDSPAPTGPTEAPDPAAIAPSRPN